MNTNEHLLPLLSLSTADQFDIAFKLAENIGYCLVKDGAAEALVGALENILEVEQEFRNSMPEGWDGDPLSDACDAAQGLLGVVGEPTK